MKMKIIILIFMTMVFGAECDSTESENRKSLPVINQRPKKFYLRNAKVVFVRALNSNVILCRNLILGQILEFLGNAQAVNFHMSSINLRNRSLLHLEQYRAFLFYLNIFSSEYHRLPNFQLTPSVPYLRTDMECQTIHVINIPPGVHLSILQNVSHFDSQEPYWKHDELQLADFYRVSLLHAGDVAKFDSILGSIRIIGLNAKIEQHFFNPSEWDIAIHAGADWGTCLDPLFKIEIL